jgi:FAM192A/Fyv6, N-terminal domain
MGAEDETQFVIPQTSSQLLVLTMLAIADTGNQFRSLEEDEVVFLDSVREEQLEEERKRKERDGEELKSFRE